MADIQRLKVNDDIHRRARLTKICFFVPLDTTLKLVALGVWLTDLLEVILFFARLFNADPAVMKTYYVVELLFDITAMAFVGMWLKTESEKTRNDL